MNFSRKCVYWFKYNRVVKLINCVYTVQRGMHVRNVNTARENRGLA